MNRVIVAVATSVPSLHLYEARHQARICDLPLPPRTPALFVKFVKDAPDCLIVADKAKEMRLWKWRERRVIKQWSREHEKVLRSLDTAPNEEGEEQ